MKRPLTVAEQYMTAALFIFMGLGAHGCGDSGTVNPVVELASLTVDPGTLQPGFSGGTTQYRVDVTTDITNMTITAQPAVAGDTVTINGQATTSRAIILEPPGSTTIVNIVVSETDTNSRTYVIRLVRAGLGGNNSLQNLTVSPGTLAPAFDQNLQAYTLNVDNNIGSVTVTPTLSDIVATTTVNGQATLSGQPRSITLNPAGQSTPITIVVTAQNGTPKSYLVSVSRGVSSNNNLQGLTVSPGTLTFRPATTSYTVDVASTVTSVTVRPTLADAAASMIVNGQATDSGEARTIALNGAGSSTFANIIVIAQNGTPKTYTVNIARGALGGNNNLSALTVSPGGLDPAFSGNRLSYTVDVASTVTSVTVSATKADPNAVMSGDVTAGAGAASDSAPIQLDGPGTSRVVSITVTAPNQSSKTYTVTIERAASASNNNLSALTVSPGGLDPAFSGNRLSYTVDVASTVTSVTVSATKADPNAVMSGDVTAGAGAASDSAPIQLDGPGTSRVVSITVTAPNQSSKTYTVTIERAASDASDNNLSALTVSPGSLAPPFNANITRYTVNVESNVTSVTVTATPQDTTAGMAINGQGTSSGEERDIALGAEGSSTNITIRVNPPNGTAKTYRVTVNRASNGDGGNNGGNGNNRGNGNNGGNNGNNGDGDDDGDDD